MGPEEPSVTAVMALISTSTRHRLTPKDSHQLRMPSLASFLPKDNNQLVTPRVAGTSCDPIMQPQTQIQSPRIPAVSQTTSSKHQPPLSSSSPPLSPTTLPTPRNPTPLISIGSEALTSPITREWCPRTKTRTTSSPFGPFSPKRRKPTPFT